MQLPFIVDKWYCFGCFITLMLNGQHDSDRQLAARWLGAARKKAKALSPAELDAFGLGRIDMAMALAKMRSKQGR